MRIIYFPLDDVAHKVSVQHNIEHKQLIFHDFGRNHKHWRPRNTGLCRCDLPPDEVFPLEAPSCCRVQPSGMVSNMPDSVGLRGHIIQQLSSAHRILAEPIVMHVNVFDDT